MNPVKQFVVDALSVRVYGQQSEMAHGAAREVHAYLCDTIAQQGRAHVILATGNSQLLFLSQLAAMNGLNWSKITLFHMDEYLGIAPSHKASFRRYMRERVETVVKPGKFHYLEGNAAEPIKECERYTRLLREKPIDLCCLGVGENGHIAFNDPPVADFADPLAVKIVELDHACCMQQVGEGHFPSLEAVPKYALTLTIPMLCSAKKMICLCPEKRKAQAVKDALTGPISTACPASFLRKQAHCTLLLDTDSVGLL